MALDTVTAVPIQVTLFGGPIVEVDGEAVRLSKYQAYLVALVFGHGREGLSRSKAIELLWNEPDGPEQRHRLSQLLYTLKRKLGGRKIVGDVGVRPSPAVHCYPERLRGSGPLCIKEATDLLGTEFLSRIVYEIADELSLPGRRTEITAILHR